MAPMVPGNGGNHDQALGGWTIPARGDSQGEDGAIAHIRKTELAVWFREIDRVLLTLILLLVTVGIIAVGASSPSTARRLSEPGNKLDDLHFFWLHLKFLALGLPVMFVTSLLPREIARRAGILLFVGMLAAMLLVPLIGVNVNGAKRWINLGIQFQPSEFLKPAFAILMAWLLSWRVRDPNLPVISLSLAVMLLVGILLMMQPDFGSTVLFGGVWFVLVLLSGISTTRIAVGFVAAVVGVVLAYYFYPVATVRINGFFAGPSAYDQVDLAQKTLLAGGWSGSGLWLGTRKLALPEAHTDYIFSVVGEEFGLIACAIIVLLFAALVIRVMVRLLDETDLFAVLAGTGLVTMFGGQAIINMAVNLRMFPSKGMTLPLISYGGSSLIALCITLGLLLAVTRRNPYIGNSRFAFGSGQKPPLLQDLRR